MMKKLLFTLGVILISNLLSYSQYNYGLDVCEKDARITGKLNLNSGNNSVFIGQNSGINNSTGTRNTYFGFNSGNSNSSGNDNTMIGYLAGQSNTTFGNTLIGSWTGGIINTGWGNTIVGYNAATLLSGGAANTMIGRVAGHDNETGSFNVFIGDSAGFHETGSNKLYIEASQWNEPDNQNPLIYGEFDNNKVQINGSLHISEFIRLIPSSAPTSPEKGTMYYDSSDDKVKVWIGGAWENIFFDSFQTETSFIQSSQLPCNTSCSEENQKLKTRVEQLEADLREFSSMKSNLDEMKKLVNNLVESSNLNDKIEINKLARLGQNAPNPFNGTTKIQYWLPENIKDARINIYNISGQIVKEVKIKGSGKGEIELQIDEYSIGIYHYSLEIDGQVIDTKKMSSKY